MSESITHQQKESENPPKPERRRVPETPLETFERYCQMLGLNPEDLKGKNILDIGAGDGNFALGVMEKGLEATVISLDSHRKRPANFPGNLEFINAGADKIPLEDCAIDFGISVHTLPTTAHMGHIVIRGKKCLLS